MKITVAVPVAPQPSLKAVKLCVQVTLPPTSVAEAPPLEASHALSWAVLPAPSVSTVELEASGLIAGGVVSMMVNVAVVMLALPHSSVAVKITVAVPVAPQPSLKAAKLCVHVTPAQMSLALAPPWLAIQAFS